jgi:hypothetical protein
VLAVEVEAIGKLLLLLCPTILVIVESECPQSQSAEERAELWGFAVTIGVEERDARNIERSPKFFALGAS